jgi:MFS family permease
MTFGQMSEIGFMLLMPFFFRALGVKKLMLVGMLAWVVRYILFSLGASSGAAATAYLGILVHGICYDFFFVTGQIYVDKKAPESLRSSAQGLIAMATYGVGMLIGSIVSGRVLDGYTSGGTHQWASLWYVPAAAAGVVFLIFAALFKDDVPAKA